MSIGQISEVEMFSMFNIDCGVAAGYAAKSLSDLDNAKKLEGVKLWKAEPIQRTGAQITNKKAKKREDMNDTKNPKRVARVEQLRKIYEACEVANVSPFTPFQQEEYED